MAAVSVLSFSEDRHVHDSRRRDTLRRRTGLADVARCGQREWVKQLVGLWELSEQLKDCNNAPPAYSPASKIGEHAVRELFRPYGEVRPSAVPPPTYEESFSDLPPDYTSTDALVTVGYIGYAADAIASQDGKAGKTSTALGPFEATVDIDLSTITGIRECANKKAKQAAKQAQQAKWNESGDEGNANGGAGGADGDQNGSGDGAGAGGDAPGGGDGGGGGDDEWFNGAGGGNKKKDKKKKKNAW